MEIFPNRYRKICNKAKKVRQLPLLEAENFFFFHICKFSKIYCSSILIMVIEIVLQLCRSY